MRRGSGGYINKKREGWKSENAFWPAQSVEGGAVGFRDIIEEQLQLESVRRCLPINRNRKTHSIMRQKGFIGIEFDINTGRYNNRPHKTIPKIAAILLIYVGMWDNSGLYYNHWTGLFYGDVHMFFASIWQSTLFCPWIKLQDNRIMKIPLSLFCSLTISRLIFCKFEYIRISNNAI